jgi:hypothetical protein
LTTKEVPSIPQETISWYWPSSSILKRETSISERYFSSLLPPFSSVVASSPSAGFLKTARGEGYALVELLDKLARPSLPLARRRRLSSTRRIAPRFLILIILNKLRLSRLALPGSRRLLLLLLLLLLWGWLLLVLHRRKLVLLLLMVLLLLVRVGEGEGARVVVTGVMRVALHRCWLWS